MAGGFATDGGFSGDAFGMPSGGDAWGAPNSGGDAFADQAFGFGGGGQFGFDGGASASAASSLGPLPEEEARRIARDFNLAAGPGGFVSGEEGQRQLQQTGLPDQMLRSIWDMSDLDRDQRLSLREFTCAIFLASQCSMGRPLPVEVRPEQQEALVREVERFAGRDGAGFEDGLSGKLGGHRPEDWSTADTAASLSRSKRNGRSRQDQSPGRLGDGGFDDRGRRGDGAFESTGLGFDSAGGLGSRLRGRDPTSRPLDGLGENGARGVLASSSSMADRIDGAGLAQLASVFEMVARLDSGGDLKRLSEQVIEERRELEGQLSRRRDFERQLQESRSQLDGLREEQRRIKTEEAGSQRHIQHLQDELMFVTKEVQDAEEDLRAVREAAELPRGGGSKERSRGPAPYASAEEERRDVLSKVRSERELLQRDHKQIEELRARLEEVFKKKLDAQVMQQSLLEKQRQTEQDRGLMLTAIEAERGKLSALRAERISMWEERSRLEREMTDVAQDRWLAEQQGPPGSLARRERAQQLRGPGVPSSEEPRSSPSAPQRPRGVPREDQSMPTVIGGPPPGVPMSEGYRGGAATSDPYERYGFGQERRAVGTADPGRGQPEALRSGYDSRKSDGRGVRNEAGGDGRGSRPGSPDRGGWNYGFGAEAPPLGSPMSLTSRQTATFGM